MVNVVKYYLYRAGYCRDNVFALEASSGGAAAAELLVALLWVMSSWDARELRRQAELNERAQRGAAATAGSGAAVAAEVAVSPHDTASGVAFPSDSMADHAEAGVTAADAGRSHARLMAQLRSAEPEAVSVDERVALRSRQLAMLQGRLVMSSKALLLRERQRAALHTRVAAVQQSLGDAALAMHEAERVIARRRDADADAARGAGAAPLSPDTMRGRRERDRTPRVPPILSAVEVDLVAKRTSLQARLARLQRRLDAALRGASLRNDIATLYAWALPAVVASSSYGTGGGSGDSGADGDGDASVSVSASVASARDRGSPLRRSGETPVWRDEAAAAETPHTWRALRDALARLSADVAAAEPSLGELSSRWSAARAAMPDGAYEALLPAMHSEGKRIKAALATLGDASDGLDDDIRAGATGGGMSGRAADDEWVAAAAPGASQATRDLAAAFPRSPAAVFDETVLAAEPLAADETAREGGDSGDDDAGMTVGGVDDDAADAAAAAAAARQLQRARDQLAALKAAHRAQLQALMAPVRATGLFAEFGARGSGGAAGGV